MPLVSIRPNSTWIFLGVALTSVGCEEAPAPVLAAPSGIAAGTGAGGPTTGGRGGSVGGSKAVGGAKGGSNPGAGGLGGSKPGAGGGGPMAAGSTAGIGNVGGVGGSGGSPTSTGGTVSAPVGGFGTPTQSGAGTSTDRTTTKDVARNGTTYVFLANGSGPGFQSESVTWNGTAFTVDSLKGTVGTKGEPAASPTVFCGAYSGLVSDSCGLPRAMADITALRTGWKWKANANAGQYNAAYTVWIGAGTNIASHNGNLRIWLRDPVGQQPAGTKLSSGITVANVPGTWDLWQGTVDGDPCVSYVRPEGKDSAELEFDVMDFIHDLSARSITTSGNHILSVAVGFDIWAGPVTTLVSEDFYVDVK